MIYSYKDCMFCPRCLKNGKSVELEISCIRWGGEIEKICPKCGQIVKIKKAGFCIPGKDFTR